MFLKRKPTGSEPVSKADLAFAAERMRLELHNLILRAFLREGITRTELASRLDKQPSQITRLLSAPGNWTIDTAAQLLAGINGNCVDVVEHDLSAASPRNDVGSPLLRLDSIEEAQSAVVERTASGAHFPTVRFRQVNLQ